MEANPILVYELRQCMRNRSVIVAILLYLTAMAGATAAATVGEIRLVSLCDNLFAFLLSFSFGSSGSPNRELVYFLFLLHYLFSTAVLIGFGAFKTYSERKSGDLLYSTELSPGRIVRGKILLGLVVCLLFGSMTLPFLSVAWLGRGVDIVDLLVHFLLVFYLIMLHYMGTLAMFSGALKRSGFIARIFPWGIGQFLLFFLSLSIILEDVHNALELLPAVSLCFLALCLLAGLFAAAQFAPESSNRMFGVRLGLSITLFFLVVGLFIRVLIAGYDHADDSLWTALFLLPLYVLCYLVPYLFLVFICERGDGTDRMRRGIPRSGWRRIAAFPFYTGVAGAMTWSVGTIVAGLLFLWLLDCCSGNTISTAPDYDPLYGMLAFLLLFFDYCATSLLFCRLFLRRRLQRHWYWIPVCVLIGGIISITFVVSWFPYWMDELNDFFESAFYLPYPWPIDDKEAVAWQYMIGEIWLALLVLLGSPWILRSFRRFKRPEEIRADIGK